jgi:tetratricopeptide (TPR) repeat protein
MSIKLSGPSEMIDKTVKGKIFAPGIESLWLAIIFLIPLLFNPYCLTAYYFVKSLALVLMVSVLLGCVIARYILSPARLNGVSWHEWIKRSPLQVAAIILGLMWIISTAFSIIPHKSIMGNLAGTMGLLPALSWILFFLIVSGEIRSRKQVFRAIYTLLISTGIVCVIGIIQFMYPHILPWFSFEGRVFSTDGNPLSLSGLLAITMPVTLAMIILTWNEVKEQGKNRVKPVLLLALFILQLACTAIAQYSITILLFVIGIFAFFTLIGVYLKRKTTFVLGILSLLMMVVLAVYLVFPILFTPNPVVLSDKPAESPIVAEQVGLPTLSIRVHAWRSAADVVLEAPEIPYYQDNYHSMRRFIGYGPETFIAVSQLTFPAALKSMYTYKSLVISQPENQFLFLAATTGILGLGAFLLFLAVFFFVAVKLLIKATGSTTGILAAAFIASGIQYCAHIFFNPAVVTPELAFWLVAALTVACIKLERLSPGPADTVSVIEDDNAATDVPGWKKAGKCVLAVGVVIVFILIGMWLTLPPYLGNLRAQEGLNLWDNEPDRAMEKLEEAVRLQPEESYYYNFIGHLSFTKAAVSTNEAEKERLFKTSEAAFDNAISHEPQMAIWRYRMADLQLYRALNGHGEKMSGALECYQQADMLFPGNAVILNKWAMGLIAAGRYEEAEKTLQKSQSADVKWVPTSFYIGLLQQHQGRGGEAGRQFVYRIDNKLENLGYFFNFCIQSSLYGQIEDVYSALHNYTGENTGDWSGWMLLGISDMYCQKYAEAIASFEKAADNVPGKQATLLAGVTEGVLRRNQEDPGAGKRIAESLIQKAAQNK